MAIDVTKYEKEIRQDLDDKPEGHTKRIMLTPIEVSELRIVLSNYRFVNGGKHDYRQGDKQTLYHITRKGKEKKRSPFNLHPRPVMKPRGSGGLDSRLNWPDRGVK